MKRKNLIRKVLLAATLPCVVADAQAASVSTDGSGQVLIFPYYTARVGYDTVFSIANPTGAAKAIRVRFREGRNGRTVSDFNLYLGAKMTWAAAVTANSSGNPVLRTFDVACTAPGFPVSPSNANAQEVVFSNAGYANYDKAGSSLDRAMEGFIEALEMGEIDSKFALPSGQTAVDAISQGSNCAALAAAWQSGGVFLGSNGAEATAPTGGLNGASMIINVQEGTTFPVEPVALNAVFGAKHHTAPGSTNPNLGDADKRSVVLKANGDRLESTWDAGIDAVSAVLMQRWVHNDYASTSADSPTLVATDLVLTFPTKGLAVALESAAAPSRPPFKSVFRDVTPAARSTSVIADGESPGACEPLVESRYARNGQANLYTYLFTELLPYAIVSACWSTTVNTIGSVFGSRNLLTEPSSEPPNAFDLYSRSGQIEYRNGVEGEFTLVSKEGNVFTGLPVIGFAARKYINGNIGGFVANYGRTSSHKFATGAPQ